jgi:hypothetical protein
MTYGDYFYYELIVIGQADPLPCNVTNREKEQEVNNIIEILHKAGFINPDQSNSQPDPGCMDRSLEINSCLIDLDDFISDLCDYGSEIERLSPAQRVFYLNQCLEREVNNGGFNQYYYNSAGNFAPETVESLRAIKANKTAGLLEKANSLFPQGIVPKDWDDRQETVMSLNDDLWYELDQQFYQYADDLNALNLSYILENLDSFCELADLPEFDS